mmetsp:Transcript_19226/g.41661  ORF Transcript_19226/g.41661 Transcript_19226/m.41661 type:complete len:571 (+) Transcript_19226:332-2044(+)
MANGNNTASAASNPKKKSELLCLVSGFGYIPPTSDVAVASDPLATHAGTAPPDRSDSGIVESVRQAARTIQNNKHGSRFEVTDQSGNLVPMQQSDTVAFLAALGLHRIGRSKMETRVTGNSMADTTQTPPVGDGSGRDALASALVFLLEADAEWNSSPALANWRAKVDNYGLLQLDIAWCYLLLESLDSLTDAIRRLDIAEEVLRKQVHSNFVTLALAQAEMSNPIPPLCAIFVRLFLLQGVANKMQNCNATSVERMGWANLLCNSLRSSCPADSVETLCAAYLVNPFTAIAALRRSNGDLNAAGNFITLDRNEEKQTSKKRRRQHKIGKCANGMDFVNLDLVPTLSNLLGYSNVMSTTGDTYGEEDDKVFGNDQSTSTLIVIGLLRLSNNGIDQSLELYNNIGIEQVLERVANLNKASGQRKHRSTSNEQKQSSNHEVRDIDLTMLISMGVEEARGRNALKATGNLESALLWLSKDDNDNTDTKETASSNDGQSGGRTAGNDSSNNSESRDHFESPDGDESVGNEIDDAHELLERELGNALSTGSKQLLEKEWLGIDMMEEWDLIQKYI